MIANTAPTVAQQAQTPTVAQQADMYNLRTTAERKPTQKFTPSTYNNQQKTKKKKQSGSEKRRRCKIRQTESEKEKNISCVIPLHTDHPHQPFFKMKKKTKVMLSSPSNPKHKLRKCNVESKRRKKYNDVRFFLLKN